MSISSAIMILHALAPAGTSAGAEQWHVFRDCLDCPEMVSIPGGTFQMGDPGGEEGRPEGPVRTVSVPPFAMARLETTTRLFENFVRDTGYEAKGDCRSWDADLGTVDYRPGTTWENPDGKGKPAPQEPVVCASWEDGRAFAAWLSDETGHAYRLPTEAEWEYAAYAGANTDYYWAGGPEKGCADANTYDLDGLDASIPWPHAECHDGFAKMAPVGSYRPNAFGLYDMTGNVWEWVEDCYIAPYPAASPDDGTAYQVEGDCARRSVRGGSWITTTFRNRPAWRGRDPEDFRTWIFGFRVARDLSSSELETAAELPR